MARTDVSASTSWGDAPGLDDDALLEKLGYRKTLSRRVNAFGNAAMSAAIISPITGIMYSLSLVMGAGGNALMVWGWLIAGLLVLFVGAAMAEINSAYPTSAALYYWSAQLAKRHNAAWSWFTGWLNFAGQIGGTASADFAAALFIEALIGLYHPSFNPHPWQTLVLFGVILLLHALANTLAVKTVAFLNKVAVWWLGLGTLAIMVYLALAKHHASTKFALSHFANSTGFHWDWYVAGIGLLFTMGTFTGFDASSHMSEETTGAAMSAPRGIIRSISFSLITGMILVLALAFAMTDANYGNEAGAGTPPLQVFLDAGNKTGATIMMVIVIGAMLFCGLANMTSNSRQIFAFSRDRAIPGWRRWRTVSSRTQTPIASVWFAAASALVLGLPYLWNSQAFFAIVSVNAIGLFSAYAIPIFLRLRRGDDFQPGPWNLGQLSKPVALIAVIWVALSSTVFLMPEVSPITLKNFNYAPVAFGVVLLVATVWWFVTARTSYKPVMYGSPAAMAEAEDAMA
jgi:amino acid transporter